MNSRTNLRRWLHVPVLLAGLVPMVSLAQSGSGYQVYISNERSGDVTVIDGGSFKVIGTIPVGKRPRGIHATPDGKSVYVALSGTPIEGPPQLDAQGNPIFERDKDDDDEEDRSDKSADGIGVIDVASRKFTGKISVGSDPEEFDISKDGTRLYVSNEDVKTASVVNIATRKVEHIIPLAQEPEGVTTAPDGKSFYVTCETGGEVFVIDTTTHKATSHFKVGARPRSVAFSPIASVAFVPSESTGQLNVVDTTQIKVTKVIDLPKGSRPMRVRVTPDGKKVYVSTGRGGNVLVFDGSSHELLDTIKVGQRPWGIALSPDGRHLFAANGPSNDVSVVDLATNKEIARVKAGDSPWGVAVVPTGR